MIRPLCIDEGPRGGTSSRVRRSRIQGIVLSHSPPSSRYVSFREYRRRENYWRRNSSRVAGSAPCLFIPAYTQRGMNVSSRTDSFVSMVPLQGLFFNHKDFGVQKSCGCSINDRKKYRRTHSVRRTVSQTGNSIFVDIYLFSNFSAAELMQYRFPVGRGPSSKTWPRCASHLAQSTSTRRMLALVSSSVATLYSEIGS
jgi:hypothetical protein